MKTHSGTFEINPTLKRNLKLSSPYWTASLTWEWQLCDIHTIYIPTSKETSMIQITSSINMRLSPCNIELSHMSYVRTYSDCEIPRPRESIVISLWKEVILCFVLLPILWPLRLQWILDEESEWERDETHQILTWMRDVSPDMGIRLSSYGM